MMKWTLPKKAAKTVLATLFVGLLATSSLSAAEQNGALKIGVINFKKVVENSKMGKQEQASFEALKKQAEKMLQDKEKEMSQIASKLDDPDYLDSLSAEAEAELKHKFRLLNQELQQNQQQLYQTLSQANFKIVQKLNEEVNKAAEKVAKDEKLDIIFNDEGTFFFSEKLDKTDLTVKALDENLDKAN